MSFDRPRSNDSPQQTPQQRAEALRQKYRGQWLVLWSAYEQRYLAYPIWIGGGGATLKAKTTDDLERRFYEFAQAVRPIHPAPPHLGRQSL